MTRAWLHCGGLFPYAIPVKVLARGPKRARVKLIHRLRWNRQWFEAGSTRYVPSDALGALPTVGCLVGIGRSRFVPPTQAAARAAVKRWRGK